jgi:hypothetical protein
LLDGLKTELVWTHSRKSFSPMRLRVTLSGALCPAIGFTVPSGVNSPEEVGEVARAAVAAQLGASPDQFTCAVDASRPGVAAAVPRNLTSALHDWAAQIQARLVSVQPLWSVATSCAAARTCAVKGVWVEEPDALTGLVGSTQDRAGGTAKTMLRSAEENLGQAQLAQWFLQHAVAESDLLKLGFGTSAAIAAPGVPRPWHQHWTRR